MRILILTRSFDQNLGGMERHTRVLVEHFLKRGWDITIATPELKAGKPLFVVRGVKILRIGKAPNELLKQSFSFWLGVRRLLLNSAADYDVIVNVGMALGGSYHLPVSVRNKIITIFHGTYASERGTFYTRIKFNGLEPKTVMGIPYSFLLEAIQRLVVRRSSKVVAVSDKIRHDLSKLYKLSPEKCISIRNFVDVDLYTYKERRAGKMVQLLFLARVSQEKGIFVLLKALHAINVSNPEAYAKIQCSIVGDGPELQAAKSLAQSIDLENATFKGIISHKEVPNELQKADIFVFPTLRNEGLPLALLEAMSTGLPCIASAAEGINEVIQDGKTGLLCKKGDISDLSNKILKLVRDPANREQLAKSARQEIEKKYGMRASLTKFDNLLLDICSKNPKS
jgi:glycosyltransferase involved in cell wall biosynthesis